jgi:cell division protein ZapA (FtsZ GTPase activity inhibitor)
MPAIQLNIQNEAVRLECAAHEQRRLEDLARALNARLGGFTGDADAMRRLALTALALLDETETKNAALDRARREIERLTDMVVEARLAAPPAHVDDERGQVISLRAHQGAA